MTSLLVIVASMFLGALMFTRLMIMYAMRRQLVDVPNERSSHVVPTPRGGGLSIVIAFLFGIVILYYRGSVPFYECVALVGSGTISAVVGLWDDHSHISPRFRVTVHFLAAAWALFWLGGLPAWQSGMGISDIALNIFWLVALVWFLNAYNFMDGIDGLAGVETLFISGAAAILFAWGGARWEMVVVLLLMAGTAGFLFWNWPPARIFMGDVGSGFLGLVLGVLAVASVRNGETSMWVWVILFGVFVVDATITVFRRILNGVCWHAAHRSHAYQHAARRLKSHGKVTAGVTIINLIWLFPLASASWRWRVWGPVFAFLAYLPLIWLALHFHAGVEEEGQK